MHPELNLLKEFTLAKFRESNYNSILGPLWSLLHPVIMLFVLYSLFSARFGKTIEGYVVYLLVGIICVNFFSNSVARAMVQLAFSHELLLNTQTRGYILVISDLITSSTKFLIEIGLCLLISILTESFSIGNIFYLLLVIFAFCAMVAGFSFVLALAFCLVRDVHHLWSFLGKILLFATPVFYSIDDLSVWAGFLVYWFNPLTPFVMAFHSIFIDHHSAFNFILLHCLSIGFVSLSVGFFLYLKFNRFIIERA